MEELEVVEHKISKIVLLTFNVLKLFCLEKSVHSEARSLVPWMYLTFANALNTINRIDFLSKVRKFGEKVSSFGEKFECSRVKMIRPSFKRCIVCRSSIKYEEAKFTTVWLTHPTQDLLR